LIGFPGPTVYKSTLDEVKDFFEFKDALGQVIKIDDIVLVSDMAMGNARMFFGKVTRLDPENKSVFYINFKTSNADRIRETLVTNPLRIVVVNEELIGKIATLKLKFY
jgi:hypothetical protein